MYRALADGASDHKCSQVLFRANSFHKLIWGHLYAVCHRQSAYKPGFPQFRVLRAPYFASQSTPAALLQSLARAGSQGRESFFQGIVSCTFISDNHRNTNRQCRILLDFRLGLLHPSELQPSPSLKKYRRLFQPCQVQGFLLLFRQTLQKELVLM